MGGVHQRLALLAAHAGKVAFEFHVEGEGQSALLQADAGRDGALLGEFHLLPARDHAQGALKARRVAGGKELLGVGAGAVVAADAPVLVGLVTEGKRAGRAGYAVLDGDPSASAETDGGSGAVVGEITSGALSPTLGHPIAMAFVAPRVSEPGTELSIDVRGTRIPATVTALPFYRRKK